MIISFSTVGAPNPIVEVAALNSPLKESILKISITTSAGIEITSARYLIKDAISLSDKTNKDTPIEISKSGASYLTSIDVRKLQPGQYRLYLKVKDKKSNAELEVKSSKKSVIKDYVNFVIESSLEVKDPGEEGKKTLAGIDSDNDGIRDDLQRLIDTKTQGDVRMAYKQFARVVQQRMLNHNDKELSNFYNHRMAFTISCLFALGDKATIINEIESELANTEARVRTRKNNMKHFHGQITLDEQANTPRSEEIKFCEF